MESWTHCWVATTASFVRDPLKLRDVMSSAIAQVALLHSESKNLQDELRSFNMTLPSRNFSLVVVR
jgi:hypothetical protein